MKKILVFGASGQLGQCLKAVSGKYPTVSILFPDEKEANILDEAGLRALFTRENPDYCINCAAYTAVDKAESDVDTARLINRDGAALLAKMCSENGSVLVQISTDFVFSGDHHLPLRETDLPRPISIYGITKLEGEEEVARLLDRHFIIRTSWLYSQFANNFVKTMLKLGRERDQLKVIADQIGSPTYAIDLADAVLHIIASGKTDYGVYHYSNEGVASWFDFTRAIFDIAALRTPVKPIPTTEYPTPARRPAYSVMDKSKIKETFALEIPYWRDSLTTCIEALNL
ncbi:MAG: dTDP-4-dehydrorhamnose reductase [Mucilaginibacter polytrichastri]|nr:dTDP-4-dehydrorhamnose reductase [Mucilaginibacter polytrichastri]